MSVDSAADSGCRPAQPRAPSDWRPRDIGLQRASCRSSCWRRPSRSSCLFVYGFILWTVYLSFTRSRLLPVYELVGFDAYERLWAQPNWWKAIQNLAIFGVALHRLCIGARPPPRDPARPEDPRRGRPAADLPLSDGAVLHRHRHGLEVVPQSRPRPGEDDAGLGLRGFKFDWLMNPDMAIYTRRDRRRLAGLGLLHGDVPGRPARHRRRDPQGGADRRRLARSRSTAASSSRCCGRSSSRPSSSSRTWRSSPTTS